MEPSRRNPRTGSGRWAAARGRRPAPSPGCLASQRPTAAVHRACPSRSSAAPASGPCVEDTATHAPLPHGADAAPARPHGARGHAGQQLQPGQLRRLPRRQGDRLASAEQRATRSAKAATVCRGQARLLRVPLATARRPWRWPADRPGPSRRDERATCDPRCLRFAARRMRPGSQMPPRATSMIGIDRGRRRSSPGGRRWRASRWRRGHADRRGARSPGDRGAHRTRCAGACWSTSTQCADDCNACVVACDRENGLARAPRPRAVRAVDPQGRAQGPGAGGSDRGPRR